MKPPDHSLPPASPAYGWSATALSGLMLILTWFSLGAISKHDPWYRNLDMNIHNTADALAINTRLGPNLIDQPALPLKFLLALDFRVRHELGLLPVWNLEQLDHSHDPLQAITGLIRVGRTHSRMLVMIFIIAAAALAYTVTRSPICACLTVLLLGGSSGLLFHGLLTRPELLCVGFGNVLAFLCVYRGTLPGPWLRRHLWLLLAGVFGGLAALEKLPGVCYLALCYCWCWLAALSAPKSTDDPADGKSGAARFWQGLLPAAAASGVLWLLFQLSPYQDDKMSMVAVTRLRLAAVMIGVLPLMELWPGSQPIWKFLLARSRELALLGGGALATFPLTYLVLRSVLPEPVALDYIARTLNLLADPIPTMQGLAANKNVSDVFATFVLKDPFLFFATPALAVVLTLTSGLSLRIKTFLTLLLVTGCGLTLLLSKRHFLAQYSLFAQAPFILIWAIALPMLAIRAKEWRLRWQRRAALTATVVAIAVFLLTSHRRTQIKYNSFLNDAMLPLNDLSLTYLFDHDSHTATYLAIMRKHYGERAEFAQKLDRYLADPAHRH